MITTYPQDDEARLDVELDADLDARIGELERDMPNLYLRNPSVFGLANAWAERHDAILAKVPAAQRATVEARLARIGIRWGVMPGARVTVEFRPADVEALANARRMKRGAAA